MSEELIGLIPAAGKGLRLNLPYPKELYPIIRDNRYKPVAQFVVENLVESGVEHIVFVINETKQQLLGYFGDGSRFGCHLSYVVQETRENDSGSTSPGLAHALDSAYHLVRGKTVCFGMADTIMKPSAVFRRLVESSNPDDDAILGVFPSSQPEKGAMVRTADGTTVIEILDKPLQTDHQHTWGCIVWRPRFTEFLRESMARNTSDFAKIMNDAIAAGLHFRGVFMPDAAYADYGTYEEILMQERLHGTVGAGG